MSTITAQNASLERDGAVLCSGVTCSFSSGELVAVVGPNGAGKSSLLALLAGDVEPASGSVNLDGRSMRDFAPVDLARQRAVLTQTNVVAFPFSVREVVSMGRFAWKSRESAVDDTAVVNAALEATDIAHLAQRRITTLSGGEIARVALARVLAQDTKVILLDEPTASLDIKHQEMVLELLRHKASNGTLVIIVVHDLEAAASIADRLLVMVNGHIVADGSPHQVLSSALLSEVYDYPIDVATSSLTGQLEIRPKRSSSTKKQP